MNNYDLLKSMKESVGEMDTEYGYSSYKLARYFKEKFPSDPDRRSELQPSELTAEDILSRVTEILLLHERLKTNAIRSLVRVFNSRELRFLIQCFEREEFRDEFLYKGENAYQRFLTNFNATEGKEFSSDTNEIEHFRKKIRCMGSSTFYFLQAYIMEDLNHLPTDSLLSWYDWFLEEWEYSHLDPEMANAYWHYVKSAPEWYENFTFEEVMEQTKSYWKGKFSKSELRCLVEFYNGIDKNRFKVLWDLYDHFFAEICHPTFDNFSIGKIENQNFLQCVSKVGKMEPVVFKAILEVLTEIWEKSKAANDGFKLFEDFLDDYASADEC